MMILEHIMTKDVLTLTPKDTVKAALTIMHKNKIRHLPLINEQKELVGLVTERDIKAATPPVLDGTMLEKQLSLPLLEMMKTKVFTGHPLDFIEDAAVLFYDYKIGCLPIICENKLVGIVTSTDLLHIMVELTGANNPSSQIEIRVKDRTGMLFEVSRIFKEEEVNVHSVLIYPDIEDDNYQILTFRIATINPTPVVELLKKEGLHVLWPNMPGMQS